jgi:hypothetical protein
LNFIKNGERKPPLVIWLVAFANMAN